MILLCGGLVLCHSDVIGQIVMAVTVPLDFLVQLRGCFILYVVNYVWPCYLEGFFDLPGRYSTIDASEAFTTCNVYVSHVLHPS